MPKKETTVSVESLRGVAVLCEGDIHEVACLLLKLWDGRDRETNATRPDSLGQSSTSAACTFAHEAGKALSTTTADGDESSRSSMIWASRPWPPPRSTTRPPRNRRRTLRATSHASYSSFRGNRPARQTLYDLGPTRQLLGYEPRDTWPQGAEEMLAGR